MDNRQYAGDSTHEELEWAIKLENEEFSTRVRSAEAKEAFTAFLEKRAPVSPK